MHACSEMASRLLAAALLCLPGILGVGAAEPKVVSMDLRRPRGRAFRERPHLKSKLSSRDTDDVTIQNYPEGPSYLMNVTVGSPPQEVVVTLDTGSSDLWFFESGVCSSNVFNECLDDGFTPADSNTARLVAPGAFSIQYADSSRAAGDFFTDTLRIGTSTVRNFYMAVATEAEILANGIFGIGFRLNHAIDYGYPTITDSMVDQGIINSRVYSLYLDTLDATTGKILFGGYDRAKFRGDLIAVPIQPDPGSGALTSFTVGWSSLGMTTQRGSTVLRRTAFPAPAILDSGTSLSFVPEDVYDQVIQYFTVVEENYQGQKTALINCNPRPSVGALEFQFGGDDGPVISVPFTELASPILNPDGTTKYFNDGVTPACVFGLGVMPAPDGTDYVILGDTFLRSAYVVYDLDNKVIALAQTVFNSTGSDIVEVQAGNSLQGVSATATEASITNNVPPYTPDQRTYNTETSFPPYTSAHTLPPCSGGYGGYGGGGGGGGGGYGYSTLPPYFTLPPGFLSSFFSIPAFSGYFTYGPAGPIAAAQATACFSRAIPEGALESLVLPSTIGPNPLQSAPAGRPQQPGRPTQYSELQYTPRPTSGPGGGGGGSGGGGGGGGDPDAAPAMALEASSRALLVGGALLGALVGGLALL